MISRKSVRIIISDVLMRSAKTIPMQSGIILLVSNLFWCQIYTQRCCTLQIHPDIRYVPQYLSAKGLPNGYHHSNFCRVLVYH